MWALLIATLPTQPNAVRLRLWRAVKALGCGAYLTGLRRTRTGLFQLSQAVTLDELEGWSDAERRARLLGVDALAAELEEIRVDRDQALALAQGKILPWDAVLEGERRVYGPDGRFLGVVEGGRRGGQPALPLTTNR